PYREALLKAFIGFERFGSHTLSLALVKREAAFMRWLLAITRFSARAHWSDFKLPVAFTASDQPASHQAKSECTRPYNGYCGQWMLFDFIPCVVHSVFGSRFCALDAFPNAAIGCVYTISDLV